jgi:transposase InsO family protein
LTTTDSNHDGPIFPNLAKSFVPTGPNQLWVADLTYIAIARGFVYLAVILDAWSRRVLGYAVACFMDARLTCGGHAPTAERTLHPARMFTESLTPRPELENSQGQKLGHSAMSAQCPVCPKADIAGRFMSTRP